MMNGLLSSTIYQTLDRIKRKKNTINKVGDFIHDKT